jgi:hypothetical protein
MPFPCLAIADNAVYDLDIRTALGSTARIPGPVPIVGAFLHEFCGRQYALCPHHGTRRGTATGIYGHMDTTSFHGDFQASSDGARWTAGKILELGYRPCARHRPPRDAPNLAGPPDP